MAEERIKFNAPQKFRICLMAIPYLMIKGLSWLAWDGLRFFTTTVAEWIDDKLMGISIWMDEVNEGITRWAHKKGDAP